MTHVLICGGAGFIGHHLAKKLKKEGHFVIVADIIDHKYADLNSYCDDFFKIDLVKDRSWEEINKRYPDDISVIYQLACNMGGAGYIFSGAHDYEIMNNSVSINLQCIRYALKWKSKVFYSSSACMYPSYNQEDPSNPNCAENSAYPAQPDSEYGWEKLFSERMYLAANRNERLDVSIARFHNIFGPEGAWRDGKEKAPAAICRKVAEAREGGTIEVWGPGTQTRSFLHIDECLEGVDRLMKSKFNGPVNIGSEEMICMNDLAKMVIDISGKNLTIKNVDGEVGVAGRNSDNQLIQKKLDWYPSRTLRAGMEDLYPWILNQVARSCK